MQTHTQLRKGDTVRLALQPNLPPQTWLVDRIRDGFVWLRDANDATALPWRANRTTSARLLARGL